MLTILPVSGASRKAAHGGKRRKKAHLAVSMLCLIGILTSGSAQAAGEPSPPPDEAAYPAPTAAGTADWIGALAEAITALSIGAVIWQISEQRKAARRERARGFQERYQSDTFDASARRMIGCMDVEDAEGCVEVIKACSNRPDAATRVLPWPDAPSKASVQDVDKTLNLFEEMGAAYKLGHLDKDTLRQSFSFPTIQVFVRSWWWICWEREGRLAGQREDGVTEEIYAEYQVMVQGLRKENSSLARHRALQPNPNIRALCLPRGSQGRVDDDAAWSASCQLSRALSDFVRSAEGHGVVDHLSALTADLESLPRSSNPSDGERPSGWQVILIPGSIDRVPDAEWERQWRAAVDLSRALDHFSDYTSLEQAAAQMEIAAAKAGDQV